MQKDQLREKLSTIVENSWTVGVLKQQAEFDGLMVEHYSQTAEYEREEKERYRNLSIRLMLNQGIKDYIIAKITHLTLEEVRVLQKKYKNSNVIDDILTY